MAPKWLRMCFRGSDVAPDVLSKWRWMCFRRCEVAPEALSEIRSGSGAGKYRCSGWPKWFWIGKYRGFGGILEPRTAQGIRSTRNPTGILYRS